MSDFVKGQKYDLEKIGEFYTRNFEALGYDTTMDGEMLRGCLACDGVTVGGGVKGMWIKQHDVIIAFLDKLDIQYDNTHMVKRPSLTLDPAKPIMVGG